MNRLAFCPYLGRDSTQSLLLQNSSINESFAFSTDCLNVAAAIGKSPTVKSVLTPENGNYFVDAIKSPTDITLPNSSYISSYNFNMAELTNGNVVIVYTNGENRLPEQH